MALNTLHETTIGALCDAGVLATQTGPFGSQLHSSDYVADGVPVIPTEAIGRRHLSTHGIPQVSRETATRLNRHRLRAGDILFARRGVQATGLSAIVTELQDGWLCGTGAILLRVTGEDLDSEFLSFLLSSQENIQWLKQHAVGAVMPNLNESIIRRMPIRLPPLHKQKGIAATLGEIDRKIELNHQMNATLDAMARALFQSWFLDFDPMHKKLDDRLIVTLEAHPSHLFPDSLEESALGMVPRGWDVKPLGEVLELSYGKPLKAESRRNGSVKVFGANGQIGWHDTVLVPGPGIIVGRKGNPGVVSWSHDDFFPIDTTFYVERIETAPSLHFLYLALSRQELFRLSADSAVPGLNRNHVYARKQLIPPSSVLEAFDREVTPTFSTIVANERQSRTLAELRDTLLPKLLSGEVKVPADAVIRNSRIADGDAATPLATQIAHARAAL